MKNNFYTVTPLSPPHASATTGKLYIVATPIGNRADISMRAMQTLQEVDAILAEDTRHSHYLLDLLGIHTPLYALHQHNEADRCTSYIQAIQQGKSFALISDAGTPLIRDPGFLLVKAARAHAIPVIPIPGACACIAALSAAGIPCDSFFFGGFLPPKKTARIAQLQQWRTYKHTIVFYESTHRICACTADIAHVFGENYTWMLAKEITKTHETFLHGTSASIDAWLTSNKAHQKGEFVCILPVSNTENKDPLVHTETTSASIDEKILSALLAENMGIKKAVQIATKISSTPKNQLYRMALGLHGL